jgi:hypothetical protein
MRRGSERGGVEDGKGKMEKGRWKMEEEREKAEFGMWNEECGVQKRSSHRGTLPAGF